MATRRVAVFIDAENVAVSSSSAILEEAMRHGVLTERRAYGDFSRPALASWLEALPRHALTPFQTAGGAVGKNGADIALVIDAMEMLCADEADVFCLATSDGDFTQLAMRVRQRGKTAIGIGRASASSRFRAACDRFTVIETPERIARPTATATPPKRRKLEQSLLREAMTGMAPSGDGWVNLSEL
ncbi:MAG TPA: NYN domain-containing protein, partial [Mycoplana sp.]|nr:NYN domain-containing protein [Mycoplana sp.]